MFKGGDSMGEKKWFLVQWTNGRPEIISKPFDTLDEAKSYYKVQLNEDVLRPSRNYGLTICETVYG